MLASPYTIHKMSLTRSLNGFLPAIVTPLNAKGDVDVPSLERLVRYMFEQGVDGLYVGGESVLPICFAPCQTVLIIPLATLHNNWVYTVSQP
jgi:hypothetical protein